MDGNRHKETAQRLPSKTKADWGDNPVFHSQTDLYKIRQELVEEILNAVNVVCFR